MEDSIAKYQNRLVAYIDILGFKEIVKQSERDPGKIQAIMKSLDVLKSAETSEGWNMEIIYIEEDAQQKGIDLFDITKNVVCTCFSDTIVASVEVNDVNINHFTSTLVANFAYMSWFLLTNGIYLRGSITTGSLIHERNGTILGPALIEAYQLETNAAKYPRIILSEKLLKKLNFPLLTKRDRYPYHQYLQRFEDGCVGFSPVIAIQVLQNWIKINDEDLEKMLLNTRSAIINGLDSNFENPDVFLKYHWLRKQYNELIILTDNVKKNIPNNPSEHNIDHRSDY